MTGRALTLSLTLSHLSVRVHTDRRRRHVPHNRTADHRDAMLQHNAQICIYLPEQNGWRTIDQLTTTPGRRPYSAGEVAWHDE